MTKIDEQLQLMETILDTLIANEEHIREISLVDPDHHEISQIQHEQESLLDQLQQADKSFSETIKEFPNPHPITLKQSINEKIHHFQQLNDSFIDRLKTGHHFIHFEVRRKRGSAP